MPKVSVIIPIYRAERYIERCARSLFEQTLDDIEYIFVDDCSPDNSIGVLRAVLSEYPNRQSQVTILHMEKNGGQAAVRKLGVKNTTGDYIIHCDSDDWLDVNAYEEMYNLALKNDADLIVCDYYYVNKDIKEKVIGRYDTDTIRFFKKVLVQKAQGCLWNKLVKSVCYRNMIWPTGDMGEDMLMCIQLIYDSNKVVHLPKALYYYNKNSSSITENMDKKAIIHRFNQSILNANDLIYFFKSRNILDEYRDEVDRMLFNKKNLLRPLINEKKYYYQWRDTFPELNYRILFNRQVSIGMKVKHVLSMMNLYHKSY